MSREGIHPSLDNVHAIEDFPMPETYTQVHAFHGLVGHYWCFIKGFAHLARPLYDVLGKMDFGSATPPGMGGGEKSEEQDTDGPHVGVARH